MAWDDIWKIILCAVGSVGGIGAIIVCAVKFSASIIAERLSKNYEAKLQKELEQYKANLEGKSYITKAQYDAEFEIYRSLSKAFFEMVVALNTTFSPDYRGSDKVLETELSSELRRLDTAAGKSECAQNLLYENGAFIPESLYTKYDDIMDKASELFWEYNNFLQANKTGKILFDSKWLNERNSRVRQIRESFIALNTELRVYLQGLCIVE